MTWLAVLSFAKSWWKAALGAVLAVAPAFLLGQCSGKHIEKTAQEAREQRAAAQAERIARAADRLLAGRKSASDAAIAADRKDLDDATAKIPDRATSDRQRVRACHELRRQGADLSKAACGDVPATR